MWTILIFFRLVFTEVFCVDVRTWSIKGIYTLSQRIICVFFLMSFSYPLHRSQKVCFQYFWKSLSSVEFCCLISSYRRHIYKKNYWSRFSLIPHADIFTSISHYFNASQDIARHDKKKWNRFMQQVSAFSNFVKAKDHTQKNMITMILQKY